MPIYIYVCEDGHRTQKTENYTTSTIDCLHPKVYNNIDSDSNEQLTTPCYKTATRQAFYNETAITFKGPGFTKTVLPPAPPKMQPKVSDPYADHIEKLHEFAHESAVYDDQQRDEAKKRVEEIVGPVMERGAID